MMGLLQEDDACPCAADSRASSVSLATKAITLLRPRNSSEGTRVRLTGCEGRRVRPTVVEDLNQATGGWRWPMG